MKTFIRNFKAAKDKSSPLFWSIADKKWCFAMFYKKNSFNNYINYEVYEIK